MLTPHASALLLLLPLAMASCPCPTAPASAKVCGSNYVTYESQCALDCAALPGLKSLHPGPCSHIKTIMGTVLNASLPNFGKLNPRGSIRSAIDDLKKLAVCTNDKCEASKLTCGCSTSDYSCIEKCSLTCLCDCYGIPSGSADMDKVNECIENQNCNEKQLLCLSNCEANNELCAKCMLDRYQCGCRCNGENARPTTSTTASSTTSASLSLRPTLGLSIALLFVWIERALRTTEQ